MADFCIENAYICNAIADAAVLQKITGGRGVLVIDEQREFDSAEKYTRIVQNTCLPRDISTRLLHVNYGYISSSAVKYNILQVLR